MSTTHELFIIKGDLSEKYKRIREVEINQIDFKYFQRSAEVGELQEIAKVFRLPEPWEELEGWIHGLSEVSDVLTKKDCFVWWYKWEEEIRKQLKKSSYWIVIIPIEYMLLRAEASTESLYRVSI